MTANKLLQDKVNVHAEDGGPREPRGAEFRPKDDGSGKLGTVVVRDRATGESRSTTRPAVFVFIGLDPNTDFVRGRSTSTSAGFVRTDDGDR